MDSFASRLKKSRKVAGKTQQQMADLLNMRVQAYQRYELGSREPNHETLISLCFCLDVTADYLLYGALPYAGGETMTRLEIMTVLLSVKVLLETNNTDKAIEVINEVLDEARTAPKQ
jgi:transcriptional regulator with XRE-family HTH domain